MVRILHVLQSVGPDLGAGCQRKSGAKQPGDGAFAGLGTSAAIGRPFQGGRFGQGDSGLGSWRQADVSFQNNRGKAELFICLSVVDMPRGLVHLGIERYREFDEQRKKSCNPFRWRVKG